MSNAIVARIQTSTCIAFGIERDELLSDRKMQNIAHARIMAMAITRQVTTTSLPSIGREFHRDHTTVISVVERAAVLLERYPAYRAKREEIIDACSEGR